MFLIQQQLIRTRHAFLYRTIHNNNKWSREWHNWWSAECLDNWFGPEDVFRLFLRDLRAGVKFNNETSSWFPKTPMTLDALLFILTRWEFVHLPRARFSGFSKLFVIFPPSIRINLTNWITTIRPRSKLTPSPRQCPIPWFHTLGAPLTFDSELTQLIGHKLPSDANLCKNQSQFLSNSSISAAKIFQRNKVNSLLCRVLTLAILLNFLGYRSDVSN